MNPLSITRRFALLAVVATFLTGLLVPAPAHAATLDLPTNAHVLLVGDSYSVGVGDDDLTNGTGYPPQLAKNMGWSITREAAGGSGYVNPACFTHCAGIYADRLWTHQGEDYELVIIQGSSNDKRYDSLTLATNINRTIRTVRRLFPEAQVVLVGPTNPGGYVDDYVLINAKLKAAAKSYGYPYISPMDEKWFTRGDYATYAAQEGDGKGHPNDKGYARIAARLTTDLKALT